MFSCCKIKANHPVHDYLTNKSLSPRNLNINSNSGVNGTKHHTATSMLTIYNRTFPSSKSVVNTRIKAVVVAQLLDDFTYPTTTIYVVTVITGNHLHLSQTPATTCDYISPTTSYSVIVEKETSNSRGIITCLRGMVRVMESLSTRFDGRTIATAAKSLQ